jgi:hypothetical protein
MGCCEETWVMVNTFKVDQARGMVKPLVMTENTTLPSNVMEHVEPRQPAVGGGSQAWEGIGLTTAKKKKKSLMHKLNSNSDTQLRTL